MSSLTGTINPAEHALSSADRFVGSFPEQPQFQVVPESPEVASYAQQNEQTRYDTEFADITRQPELQAVAETAAATDLAVPASNYNMYATPTQPETQQPVANTYEALDGRMYNVGDVQTEALRAAHAVILARNAVTQEFIGN